MKRPARPGGSVILEQPAHGPEHHVALGLGVGALRPGERRQPLRELRHQPGELAAVDLGVAPEELLGRLGDEIPQRLDPRLVRRAELLLAASGEHDVR